MDKLFEIPKTEKELTNFQDQFINYFYDLIHQFIEQHYIALYHKIETYLGSNVKVYGPYNLALAIMLLDGELRLVAIPESELTDPYPGAIKLFTFFIGFLENIGSKDDTLRYIISPKLEAPPTTIISLFGGIKNFEAALFDLSMRYDSLFNWFSELRTKLTVQSKKID